jgi:hypothetical protein
MRVLSAFGHSWLHAVELRLRSVRSGQAELLGGACSPAAGLQGELADQAVAVLPGERGPRMRVLHSGLDPLDVGPAPVCGGGEQRGVPAAYVNAGAGAGGARVAVEGDPLRDQVAELPARDLRRLLPDVDQAERLAVLQDDDGSARRAGDQDPVRRRAGKQADAERYGASAPRPPMLPRCCQDLSSWGPAAAHLHRRFVRYR